MGLIAYHASHEQFRPSQLLAWTRRAEEAGFDAFFSSDHFHPWSEKESQSGYSWSWMGAALTATSLPGRLICCPGYRQHPAIVAQAGATLAEMFPERFWLALGSGQALNEKITGGAWPAKDERQARLRECAEVIRALWAGETVTHRGLVQVEEAKLFTRPERPPLLIGAAVTEETARWLGSWVDGLLTTSRPREALRRMREAFCAGGGEGKPLFVKAGLAYAKTEEAALAGAHAQWRNAAFANEVLTELRTPAQFDMLGRRVSPEDMRDTLRISSSLEQHAEWIAGDLAEGCAEVILHNVNTNQEEFIDVFAEKVLPQVQS